MKVPAQNAAAAAIAALRKIPPSPERTAAISAVNDLITLTVGYELTRFDHEMIRWAKRRGCVRLDDDQLCVLIAWRPVRNRKSARVELPSGAAVTLPVERITGLVQDDHAAAS